MQLIIIRGPAGSGKSSVAKKLHETATQKTALLPLDIFIVNIAKEQEGVVQITADIIEHAAKKFLAAGYTVILEGVFNIERECYKNLFEELFDYNQGPSHLYFLEMSLEESIKRKQGRPEDENISKDDIKMWYSGAQKTGYSGEKTIDVETTSLQEVVNRITKECNLTLDENNYKKIIESSF